MSKRDISQLPINPGQLSFKRIVGKLIKATDTDAEEEITAPDDSIPDAFDRQEHRDDQAIHTAQDEELDQNDPHEERSAKIKEIVSDLEKAGFKLSTQSYPIDLEDNVVDVHLADGPVTLNQIDKLLDTKADNIMVLAADELSLRLQFTWE